MTLRRRAKGLSRPVSERFWEKVQKGGPDECWLWTAYKSRDGYGHFHLFGHTFAHRHSWSMEHKREIPKGMTIDHLCMVRHCVNPKHLELVTRSENAHRAWVSKRGF